eukprot:Skav226148  [mRNA]  locus=scaffold1065:161413:170002:- [translate_table: standard]
MASDNLVFSACCDANERGSFGGATYLVALDANTGRRLWKKRPEWRWLAYLVDNSILFADSLGAVYRLNATDGSTLWSHPAPQHAAMSTGGLTTSPNGIAYVTSNAQDPSVGVTKGFLSAYFITDGHLLWQKALPMNLGLAEAGDSGHRPQPSDAIPGLTRIHGSLAVASWGSGEICAVSFPADVADSFANPAIGGDGSVYIAGAGELRPPRWRGSTGMVWMVKIGEWVDSYGVKEPPARF